MKSVFSLIRCRFLAACIFCLVFLIPHLSVAQCSVNVTQPLGTFCTGSSIVLTAAGLPFGGTYSWSAGCSSGCSSATATYTASVGYTVTATYIYSGCTATYPYTLSAVDPEILVDPGPDSYISCPSSSTPIALGALRPGSGYPPTGRGGTHPLTYAWNPGSYTGRNPYPVTVSTPTTYCVTVTDAVGCSVSACQSFTYGPFMELLDGYSATSTIRGATDIEADLGTYSPGMIYACGLFSDDIFGQNNTQYKIDINGGGTGPFVWVAQYDPCSPEPGQWGAKIGTYTPDCATGECVQPSSPNIALNWEMLYVSFNAQGTAYIAEYKISGGSPFFVTPIPDFVITDMKDDGSTYVFVTGYATSTSLTLGGTTYMCSPGDIFVGSLNDGIMYYTSLSWAWTSATGLNIYTDNLPSVSQLNYALPNFGQAGMILTTGDVIQFYDPFYGTLLGSWAGPFASGINTRIAASTLNPYFYITDGNYIYWWEYNINFQYGCPTCGPWQDGSVAATNPSIFDLRTDYSAGNVYSITTNQMEGYDYKLSPLGWNPASYNACPSSGFSAPEQADRCICLDPTNSMPMYIGGMHPTGPSCYFSPCPYGPFTFSGANFGFIARLDAACQFYKTNPNEPDNPIAALMDKKAFGIYPNPVQDELYIQTDTASDGYSYSLRTIEGKTVMSGSLSGSGALNMLSTSSLASGIYLIQVRSEGQVWTDKIVKE